MILHVDLVRDTVSDHKIQNSKIQNMSHSIRSHVHHMISYKIRDEFSEIVAKIMVRIFASPFVSH